MINDKTIKQLEEALSAAKCGDLECISLVITRHNGETVTMFDGNIVMLVGLLSVACRKVSDMVYNQMFNSP